MIIKECYIENFGKLSGFKKDFGEGLNVICTENGWGKTTFSAFIRSMLFGMESKRAKDSIREKYRPWQGGKYGGYIIFSARGKTYRIERYFKETESKDTFELFDCDTGLSCNDFTKDLGREIFKTDRDTFSKTAYIPQGQTEVYFEKSGGIIASLSSDAGLSDNKNYDKAQEAITKAKTFYEKRGGGKLAELQNLSVELSDKISRTKALIDEQNNISEAIGEKKNELLSVEKEIKELRSLEAERQKKKTADSIQDDISYFEKEIAEKSAKLTFLPTNSDMEKLKELTDYNRASKAEAEAFKLNDEEETKLKHFEEKYKASAEDISKLSYFSENKNGTQKKEKQSRLLTLAFYAILLSFSAVAFKFMPLLAWSALSGIFVTVGIILWFFPNKHKNRNEMELVRRFAGKSPSDNTELYEAINLILKEHSLFSELKTKKDRFEKKREEADAAYNALLSFAKKFADCAPENAYAYIESVLHDIASARENAERSRKKLAVFLPVIDVSTDFEQGDIDEAEYTEKRLSSEIYRLEAEYRQLEEKISALPSLSEKHAAIKSELSEKRAELDILNKTSEALLMAKQALGSKYSDGIKQHFSSYSSLLSAPFGADINAEFDINVPVHGELMPSSAFSSGERDIMGLALRFAVIPALYTEEMPPIIMDDALVNLDGEKQKKAKAFIETLSSEMQIIYFTCDENRAEF